MRRYGKRKISKGLEAHQGITVKAINKEIKDCGFMMRQDGYNEWDWPRYMFFPIGRVTHKLDSPVVIVYALGDYTVKEWKGILYKLLKDTDPRYETAAINRQRRKRRRRDK